MHKALTSAAHLWDQLEHWTSRECELDFTDAHVIEWSQIPKSRFVMFHNQLKAFADKWRLLYQPTPYYCPWFQGRIFNMHTQKWLCAHTIGHSALHTAWIMLPMSVQLQFLEWLCRVCFHNMPIFTEIHSSIYLGNGSCGTDCFTAPCLIVHNLFIFSLNIPLMVSFWWLFHEDHVCAKML